MWKDTKMFKRINQRRVKMGDYDCLKLNFILRILKLT
jgi:hypothetical protein